MLERRLKCLFLPIASICCAGTDLFQRELGSCKSRSGIGIIYRAGCSSPSDRPTTGRLAVFIQRHTCISSDFGFLRSAFYYRQYRQNRFGSHPFSWRTHLAIHRHGNSRDDCEFVDDYPTGSAPKINRGKYQVKRTFHNPGKLPSSGTQRWRGTAMIPWRIHSAARYDAGSCGFPLILAIRAHRFAGINSSKIHAAVDRYPPPLKDLARKTRKLTGKRLKKL